MASAEVLSNPIPDAKQHVLLEASTVSMTGGLVAEKEHIALETSTTFNPSGSVTEKEHLSFRQPRTEAEIPYPASNFQLENHPIDEVRSLRVAVIGAGLSGVLAGILLPIKVPGISLTIFEKNSDVVSPLQSQSSLSCASLRVLIKFNITRGVRGWRTFILGYDVIYRLTSTNPHSRQTLNGRKNLLRVARFEITGKVLQGSMMFTATSNLVVGSRESNGSTASQCGF